MNPGSFLKKRTGPNANRYPGRIVTVATETIAIIKHQRNGFEELEALPRASLFWRRRQQAITKMENRERFGNQINIKLTPSSRRLLYSTRAASKLEP